MAIQTPIDPASPRSRRAILAAAGGGLAALAAGALAGASPVLAANGDAVTVGGSFAGTSTTVIANTTNATTVFEADSTSGTAISASSSSDNAVEASSSTAIGVLGVSATGSGVTGAANNGGNGVFGYSGPSFPTPPGDTGVFGQSDRDAAARGVYGTSPAGQGVRGEATTTGVGIYATAPLTGVALQASGKVKLSRSGRATVAAGTSAKTVSLAGVTTASLIFAMLGSNRSGRWVRAVVPASGSFAIYLNTTVLSTTYVNWFVLN
ncbi:MAG TPA: hypothetical protein VKR30_02515 [Candidatus Limnocylindrales bacterium]|nr:hypothetical protein [Candidatus Limnocylindrales bacterium]